jgi:hypothetical protein
MFWIYKRYAEYNWKETRYAADMMVTSCYNENGYCGTSYWLPCFALLDEQHNDDSERIASLGTMDFFEREALLKKHRERYERRNKPKPKPKTQLSLFDN